MVDPSEITPTEILDLKTIVRPQSQFSHNGETIIKNEIILPKTSHVARSNSLRSSSPPRVCREFRGGANVPPSVPEESPQHSQINKHEELKNINENTSNFALNKMRSEYQPPDQYQKDNQMIHYPSSLHSDGMNMAIQNNNELNTRSMNVAPEAATQYYNKYVIFS